MRAAPGRSDPFPSFTPETLLYLVSKHAEVYLEDEEVDDLEIQWGFQDSISHDGKTITINPQRVWNAVMSQGYNEEDAVRVILNLLSHEIEHIRETPLESKRDFMEDFPETPRLAGSIINIVEDVYVDHNRLQRFDGLKRAENILNDASFNNADIRRMPTNKAMAYIVSALGYRQDVPEPEREHLKEFLTEVRPLIRQVPKTNNFADRRKIAETITATAAKYSEDDLDREDTKDISDRLDNMDDIVEEIQNFLEDHEDLAKEIQQDSEDNSMDLPEPSDFEQEMAYNEAKRQEDQEDDEDEPEEDDTDDSEDDEDEEDVEEVDAKRRSKSVGDSSSDDGTKFTHDPDAKYKADLDQEKWDVDPTDLGGEAQVRNLEIDGTHQQEARLDAEDIADDVVTALKELKNETEMRPARTGHQIREQAVIRRKAGDLTETKVFKRKMEVERGDTMVGITLDASGSMEGTEMQEGLRAIGALGKATEYMGDEFCANTFWSSGGKTETTTVTGPHESFDWSHLDRVEIHHADPMALGIKNIRESMEQGDAEEQLMIVITDGNPTIAMDGSDAGGGISEKAVKECIEQVDDARDDGFTVIGIGAGNGPNKETMNRVFGEDNWMRFDPEELADRLVEIYKNQVRT